MVLLTEINLVNKTFIEQKLNTFLIFVHKFLINFTLLSFYLNLIIMNIKYF